jgi:hypothetical protein
MEPWEEKNLSTVVTWENSTANIECHLRSKTITSRVKNGMKNNQESRSSLFLSFGFVCCQLVNIDPDLDFEFLHFLMTRQGGRRRGRVEGRVV